MEHLNKSFDDKINFRKKLNLKDNFENILDSGQDERTLIDEQNIDILKTKSKTFKVKKSSNKKAPRSQPIIIDEYIKPLRLDSNKSIIREISQKDIIECKSCDDKSDKRKNCMNFFNYEDKEEEIENTLKINKINEINIETKKMLFDYKLNSKYYNEYENILNIEKIFFKNVYNNDIYDDVLIGKNKNMQNRDKRKFWRKHINNFKKELNYIEKSEKNINKNEFRKRRSDTFSKKSNHEGLFILGVLQSAAKEKKGRRTVHNKRIKYIQKDGFEDEK